MSDVIDRAVAIRTSASKPTAPSPTQPAPTDWSSYLGIFGLPADVQRELNAIFNRTPDVNQAVSLALAYVRGTPWYAQEYAGINEGIAKGIIRNEQDYRANRNAFTQVYQQYAQRDITADEYASYLREGVSSDVVGKRFQGASIASVYGNDWQYAMGNFGEGLLSSEEKTAFGRQSAGLDSELGMRIQRRLQQANERIKSVFSGSLATSQLKVPQIQQADTPDIGR